MSDIQPTNQTPTPKANNSDAAFALMKTKPPLSHKQLRLILFAGIGVAALALTIGLTTASKNTRPRNTIAASQQPDLTPRPPSILNAALDKYLTTAKSQDLQPAPLQPTTTEQPIAQQAPDYRTYNETPTATQEPFVLPSTPRTPAPRPQPKALDPTPHPNQFSAFPPQTQSSAPQPRPDNSPILYPATGPPPQALYPSTPSSAPAAGGGSPTDYQRQNLDQQKQSFLASQKADYGAYLDNSYLTPADPAHEIMAGTIIPITMITGINSDNPGTIIAQVNHDVYDSLTGDNILIPRGTRLLGSYDSLIAFGQDRVLVAWNRLIRPDGTSIELRGMPGSDAQGQAGFADTVNYHLGLLLAGITLATAFNVAQDVALSALSTASFLNSLAQAAISNSQSQGTTNQANQVVQQYSDKLINQQPTITIRPGYNAVVIVNKDIILPTFAPADLSGALP